MNDPDVELIVKQYPIIMDRLKRQNELLESLIEFIGVKARIYNNRIVIRRLSGQERHRTYIARKRK